MRKLTFISLILLFVGMQNLVADGHEEKEGKKLTVKVNPYVKGSGTIYLSGNEYRQLANPVTAGAKGQLTFDADYGGIGGLKLEIIGGLDTRTIQSPQILLNQGFAYIHILQAFGIDKKIFDLYLKSGKFKLAFGKGGSLRGTNQINMQLDMKILNMLTVRTGVGFFPFEAKAGLNKDLGFSLHFDKTFADFHKVTASAGYTVDLTNNQGDTMEGKLKAAFPEYDKDGKQKKASGGTYFDQFGADLSYTGTFGMIKIKPFFGLTIQGLVAKPRYSWVNPLIGWNAGLRFELSNADKINMVYTQLDFDGEMRKNNDYKSPGKDVTGEYVDNKAFKGLKVTLGSHALKALMGKQYLHLETSARFDIDSPKSKRERKGFLDEFKFSATQHLIAATDASVKLMLGFGLKNIAPYYEEGVGYLEKSIGGKKQDAAFKSHIDIGLEASFTGKIERMVK